MVPVSLKIEEYQIKMLEAVSKETHIPKSSLIRQGIDLILCQHKEDIVTADVQRKIDTLLKEDAHLLKRLAKA